MPIATAASDRPIPHAQKLNSLEWVEFFISGNSALTRGIGQKVYN
ncbi:hypothetical protein [Nostoc sp. NMS7]|nr:hypothetical protein [Nostoc sp. NMS7]